MTVVPNRYRVRAPLCALAFALSSVECATVRRASDGSRPIEAGERAYAEARTARDRLDVARARGPAARASGVDVDALARAARAARAVAAARLAQVSGEDERHLRDDDRRAVAIMRRGLANDLSDADGDRTDGPSSCDDAPGEGDAPDSLDVAISQLTRRIYACYTRAVQAVRVGDSTTDRLSVLSALGRERDGTARRRLFLALDTIWRSMNGDDGAGTSPYRRLAALSARRWKRDGSPLVASATALGLHADSVERWLERALARWRDATPTRLVEPWDWWYEAGAAGRRLEIRIPLARLAELDEQVYASLGASPAALGVHFDLAPRPGKTPVAFTTFGARPTMLHGGGANGEPWVFATYRVGGLDNLNELLHETGHAVHIAAIRTRPAFADWPDSDTFTEALADLVAADVYEPGWQWRWLGDSASTAENQRAKLAPVMLDVAWALFELRMHRDPTRDPNVVWTELTRSYLRIAPHPELSWWAMRGQLVDLPGYMANYALGAIITADMRSRAHAVGGAFFGPWGSRWYPWLTDGLYRYGLEKTSGEVLRGFLGRAVAPGALLEELGRVR